MFTVPFDQLEQMLTPTLVIQESCEMCPAAAAVVVVVVAVVCCACGHRVLRMELPRTSSVTTDSGSQKATPVTYTSPITLSITEKLAPHAIVCTNDGTGTHTGTATKSLSDECLSLLLLLMMLPCPSCPCWLLPHPYTLPSSRSAST